MLVCQLIYKNISELYQLRKVVQLELKRKKYLNGYINFIRDFIESGTGISLNNIHDMVNDKETIFITNLEVKTYSTWFNLLNLLDDDMEEM